MSGDDLDMFRACIVVSQDAEECCKLGRDM